MTLSADAVVIDAFGGRDRFRAGEIAVPAPGPEEVRLRVTAAAINPVDLQTRAGRTIPAADAHFPMVLGWDAAGVVETAGASSSYAPGDRVAVVSLQVVHQRGTYARAMLAEDAALAPIPDDVSDAVAAATPLAGLTAFQGLAMLEPLSGQSLVVNGAAGAVGRFAVQLAARQGATVVAVAGADDDDTFLRDLGATVVVDRGGDVAAATRDALGAPADLAFDLVGGTASHAAFEAVRDGGRYVTAVPRRVDPTGAFDTARSIAPRPVFVRPSTDQLTELLQLVAAGRLDVPVAHRLPLTDVAEGHALVAAGGLRGKVVLEADTNQPVA